MKRSTLEFERMKFVEVCRACEVSLLVYSAVEKLLETEL